MTQATTVGVEWQPPASYQNVRAIVPPDGQFNWAFLHTTYTGTSLLVLPAPASGCLIACGALLATRRR